MIALFPVYLLFALFVIVKERENRHTPWFVLTLLGFCLSLLGLVMFTEYVSYSTYTENPLFKSGGQFIWYLNYFLGLDVESMYRLMNVGIALYLFGAVTFPFSVDTEGRRFALVLGLAAVPAVLILADDPAVSQTLAGASDPFLGQRELGEWLGAFHLGLSLMVKGILLFSIASSVWVIRQVPRVLRRQFQYMMLGVIPFHVLVFFLFYWYPNHSPVIWRFSLLSPTYFPYGETLYSVMFGTALVSVAAMVVVMLRHQSLRLTSRHTRLNFNARMKTASTGIKVFSHSIKNQFVAIRLISDQLAAQPDLSPEEHRAAAEKIRAICDKGIAKLSSLPLWENRPSLRYTREDLVPVLRGCSLEFPQADFQSALPRAVVRVDLACFQEVVHNLLVNSTEASAGASDPRIHLTLERQFRYFVLVTEDHGAGMSPETLRHAFDPFYSSKPAISNWGLGLPYCKQVVEAFGGAISLGSKAGVGTKVTIYLPEAKDVP